MPCDAQKILTWTLETFPNRTVITVSFGGSGLILAHMLSEIDRTVPVSFIDTRFHFDETLALRDDFVSRYGIRVDTLAVPEAEDPGPLYLKNPDRCCFIRKVLPLQRALDGRDARVSALRRDQSDTRANVQLFAMHQTEPPHERIVLKVHPLFDWTRDDVERYRVAHGIPEHPLSSHGYRSIGCWPCTTRVASGEPDRAGRWRGTSKTECGLHFPASSEQ
jgi:phosphoadenosine phosphosulfate reductase